MSLAALLFIFPAEPTGFAVAKAQQSGDVLCNDASPIADTSDLKECSKQLNLEKNYVAELVDIVLNKCGESHLDFENVASDIAKKNSYSEDGFNCVYYSELLTDKLKNMGYNARVVSGLYKGQPHSWVVMELPIEATNGNLIAPQYYSYYQPQPQ